MYKSVIIVIIFTAIIFAEENNNQLNYPSNTNKSTNNDSIAVMKPYPYLVDDINNNNHNNHNNTHNNASTIIDLLKFNCSDYIICEYITTISEKFMQFFQNDQKRKEKVFSKGNNRRKRDENSSQEKKGILPNFSYLNYIHPNFRSSQRLSLFNTFLEQLKRKNLKKLNENDYFAGFVDEINKGDNKNTSELSDNLREQEEHLKMEESTEDLTIDEVFSIETTEAYSTIDSGREESTNINSSKSSYEKALIQEKSEQEENKLQREDVIIKVTENTKSSKKNTKDSQLSYTDNQVKSCPTPTESINKNDKDDNCKDVNEIRIKKEISNNNRELSNLLRNFQDSYANAELSDEFKHQMSDNPKNFKMIKVFQKDSFPLKDKEVKNITTIEENINTQDSNDETNRRNTESYSKSNNNKSKNNYSSNNNNDKWEKNGQNVEYDWNTTVIISLDGVNVTTNEDMLNESENSTENEIIKCLNITTVNYDENIQEYPSTNGTAFIICSEEEVILEMELSNMNNSEDLRKSSDNITEYLMTSSTDAVTLL